MAAALTNQQRGTRIECIYSFLNVFLLFATSHNFFQFTSICDKVFIILIQNNILLFHKAVNIVIHNSVNHSFSDTSTFSSCCFSLSSRCPQKFQDTAQTLQQVLLLSWLCTALQKPLRLHFSSDVQVPASFYFTFRLYSELWDSFVSKAALVVLVLTSRSDILLWHGGPTI